MPLLWGTILPTFRNSFLACDWPHMSVSVNPTHAKGTPWPLSTHGHLLTMFVLYIKVYVIDKTWSEDEANQKTYSDHAINQ